MGESLHAPHVLEYTYTRSVGPVIGAYLGGLRDGRLLGIRSQSAGVLCPPVEYDPATSATLGIDDLVDVGPEGTVTTWTWAEQPREGQPLGRPFAWALIRPDGADTALLHVVDTGAAGVGGMATGMRVRARFAAEADRTGDIADLICFEPVEG